jgi:hypothetical protein
LFIGNSYTFVNDLPGMLTQIAGAPDASPHIVTSSVTQGGATLSDLWNGASARDAIAQGGWTHVVLQEQSVTAPCSPDLFYPYAARFAGAAKDAGATPAFYETWARADASTDYASLACLGGTPAAMQDELLAAYAKAATDGAGVLVPAGEAWRAVRAGLPSIDLFQSDGSHPTPDGTYLTACTFYVKLTGQRVPAGTQLPSGVDAARAADLREAAWQAAGAGGVACGPATCARGCCENGTCAPFALQSSSRCGTGNAACSACAGMCALGRCEVTLASGQSLPQYVAVDATHVYWTSGGSVMKVPLGGGSPTALASGQKNPSWITVDTASVYWTNSGDGAVMKVPLGGGTPATIASGSSGSIAVDASNVYWSNGSGVMKTPLGGGNPTALASGAATSIAVDATSVYFTNASALMKVPLAGGSATTLASGQSVRSIAVDGTSVYWTDFFSGSVMKVPLGGGALTTVASGQDQPVSVTVDATSLYWSNLGIVKLPVAGGVPTLIASRQSDSSPIGIAVDATSVYWTNPVDGVVMKVTPK